MQKWYNYNLPYLEIYFRRCSFLIINGPLPLQTWGDANLEFGPKVRMENMILQRYVLRSLEKKFSSAQILREINFWQKKKIL